MKMEDAFGRRRTEIALEEMRQQGDVEALYQMALQLNNWAWVLKEQVGFTMKQNLERDRAQAFNC